MRNWKSTLKRVTSIMGIVFDVNCVDYDDC